MARRTELALASLVLGACQRTPGPPERAAPAASHAVVVPSTDGVVATALPRGTGITIDGEWGEPAWNTLAVSGPFVDDDGHPARPVSQIRMLVQGADLIVGLYAADENIGSGDAFDVVLGAQLLHIDPHGTVATKVPGVRAAADTDGTLDDPRDDDEEWLLEVAIPIASLYDVTPLAVLASRCDQTKDGLTHCGHWTGAVTLP